MINVGIIGCGHWGPNHIRIFSQLQNANSFMAADLDEARLNAIKASFPSIETTKDYKDILNHKDIDAVCISAPTKLHYQFAKEALEHDKHVLCEKPLTLEAQESEELHALAKAKGKVLIVGHVFLFNKGIQAIKEYIDSGELGDIFYAHSERTNLGPFRYDVNALWDLAPHDISIFNYLFGTQPASVSASGHKCLGNSQEDLSFATMRYPNNILVNVHVSWIDPRKVRQITIVGSKKMLLWDDLDALGPIRIYDKHVEKTDTYYQTYGEFQLLSREGSIMIPKLNPGEPLKAQDQFFIDCIEGKDKPDVVDGLKGADVVRTLSAIQESMDQNGNSITLSTPAEVA